MFPRLGHAKTLVLTGLLPLGHKIGGVLLRLLRPGGSHHRGGASIGAPASRLPVALASTDPGTIHQAVEAIIYKNILEYR